MARADRRRAQRTRPAAAARRSDVVIEDTMFFPRLRRHAKWMFLVPRPRVRARLRRVRRRRGWRRLRRRDPRCRRWRWAPSVSDAEQRVLDNPKDAQAFKDLCDRAAGRREHRRRDRGAPELRRAAPEEHRRAARARRALPAAGVEPRSSARRSSRHRSAYLAPGTDPRHDLPARREPAPARPDHECREHELPAARSRRQRRRSRRRRRRPSSSTAGSPRSSRRTRASSSSWRRPPQSASDSATTIAAYKAFLKLAPDDPTAPEVRRILKQLQ